MLARKLISFNSLFRPYFGAFYFSSSIYNNLFKSNYHLKGPNSFKKYQQAALLNEEEITEKIAEAAEKLHPLREKVVKNYPKKIPLITEKNPIVIQYAKGYSELMTEVEQSQLNNIWVWNIIGWYNFTSMYAELYWQLITTTSIQEMRQLISCLNMMNMEPQGEQSEILKGIYQTTNYQQFYKTLFPNLEVEYLRQLESIMNGPRTFAKRKYYEMYLRNHLQKILKNLNPKNERHISNLIWLLQASVKELCDDDILIGKIEKYVLTVRALLKDESIERLINLYKIKGKINPVIYEVYLKKYITKKMKTFDDAIDTYQFYIYSEVVDAQLLDIIYERLAKIDTISQISPQSAEKLHILSHFQKINQNKLKLTDTLANELDDMCANKKFHDNQNHLDSLVLKCLDKQANQGKFISKCLVERPGQLTLISQEQIDIVESTKILKNIPTSLRDSNTYGKNKFCCFELEYVMQSKSTTEVVVFQLSSIDNCLNSGRLVRQMSIRDKILKYYGIRVHYPNLNGLKMKGKLTPEDFIISKKYTVGEI